VAEDGPLVGEQAGAVGSPVRKHVPHARDPNPIAGLETLSRDDASNAAHISAVLQG
jgi:hypothetical protein